MNIAQCSLSLYWRPQAAFSHWILFSQTEMRADLPRVHTSEGGDSWHGEGSMYSLMQ